MHNFCNICLKSYIQDQIEQNKNEIKCPLLKCSKDIETNNIKKLLSENYLIRMNSNKQNLKYFHDNIVKTYLSNHVLDITDNIDTFRYYHKNKDNFCLKCKQSSMFTKLVGNFIKCLNCLSKYCRYCLKEYSNDHFNKEIITRCKVYYRNNGEFKKVKIYRNFIIGYILVIFSYLLLVSGLYFNISNYIIRKLKLNIFLFKLLIKFTIFVLCFLFSLFILPFYPITYNIIEFYS